MTGPSHNYPTHRHVATSALTDRRRTLLTVIFNFVAEHGYAPTLRELVPLLGMQAHSCIGYNLSILKRAKLLDYACDKRGKMMSRTLALTELGLANVNPNLVGAHRTSDAKHTTG